MNSFYKIKTRKLYINNVFRFFIYLFQNDSYIVFKTNTHYEICNIIKYPTFISFKMNVQQLKI